MAGQPRPAAAITGLHSLRALLVALAAIALVTPVAHAHEEVPVGPATGRYRSVLVKVPADVRATLLPGPVPGISLTSVRKVVVFGERGEAMARVHAALIQVNQASATWRITATARGDEPGSGWRTLHEGQLSWLEPRAKPQPPDRRSRTWRVPISVDGKRTALVGETRWVPPGRTAPSSSAAPLYGIVIVVVATIALALVQRRRSAASGVSQRER